MVIGIIGIVIGVVWYLHSFAFSVGSAPQQTVQYLGFVCGSIFLVGGMILLKLHAVHGKLESKLENIDENIEIVYKDKLFEETPVSENEQ